MGEAIAEDGNEPDTETVTEPEEAENPGDTDTTEGEESGAEEVPAVDGEDNSDDQTSEETPDAEENPVEEAGDLVIEEENSDLNADEPVKLAEPVITVKNGDSAVEDLTQALPNRAEGITFEIAAVEGVTFKYTLDGTDPTKDTTTVYGDSVVSVTAPDQDTAGSVVIKAIAVKPATGTEGQEGYVAEQISDVVTVTVNFQAKAGAEVKTISLSTESEPATVKIGETTLTADVFYEIADAENDLYAEVTATGDNADKLFEVMYKDGPDSSEAVWTGVKAEEDGDNKGKYKLPKDCLTKNLVVKVVYMREIALDWQGDANWESVEITAKAIRAGADESNESNNEVIFGDRLKADKPALANKILAPKNTKVTLEIYSKSESKVTLGSVTLKEGEGEAKEQEIKAGKAAFTVSENITADYTVAIKSAESVPSTPTTGPFADKITMKKEKAASGLYTGQEAKVATVDFGKNTKAEVEIYDIPYGFSVKDGNGNWVDWWDDDTAVLKASDLGVTVRVDEYATPGKYTIKARTTYNKDKDDETSVVQATASLPVTVVQGIYDISASAPAQILQTDKGATAKITVDYNTYSGDEDGSKGLAPKTKKVTYMLVKGEGSDEKNEVAGITVDENKGTIKVDVSYTVKEKPEENRYVVRVKAADYDGNQTKDYVLFEVTKEAIASGYVVIVAYDYEAGYYKDLAPNSDGKNEIPINKINDGNAQAVIVKELKSDGKYTSADFIPNFESLYTMTFPKGISNWGDGYFGADKLGKNLVIKAVPVDGSDKKGVQSNKFSVVYADSVPENEVSVSYKTKLDFGTTSGSLKKGENNSLDVPAGTVITLNVTDKDGNLLTDSDCYWGSIFDYVLSAKNAKVVGKRDGGLSIDIIVSKNPATITLKKGRDVVTDYSIEIPMLKLTGQELKDLNNITPKVSLKKGTKIYPNSYEQELGFTMNKAVEGARYVMVSRQNNDADTNTLYWAIEECSGSTATLNANTKEFAFELNLEGSELKKGASLAFVFLDRDGKAITKTTNAIKIKTTAVKKNYKLDAKYTMSTKDAFRVPLTGKGTGVDYVEFKKLYNANLKVKGVNTVNHFKDGFRLDDGMLEIVADEDGKAKAESLTKNDLIGFVEYDVYYDNMDYPETYVSKIQVNLKTTGKKAELGVPTAKKYAASAVGVLNPGAGNTVEGVTYVTTGKLNADIRAAKIIYDSKATDADKGVEVKKVNGNEVTLIVKGDAKNKTYNKGKLYVLPLTGMYAYSNDYMNWTDDEWKKNGVELKCNVSLKAANSKNKIKKPAKSVSFLNVEPTKLALDGKGKMYYYAELPYTVGVFATVDDKPVDGVEKIKLSNKPNKKDPATFSEVVDLIKVRKVNNKSAFGFYIDAEKFKEKVEGNKVWSGATFSKIEMEVPYTNQGAVADKVSFSLTLPNPWNIMSANEAKLSKIIRVINGDGVKINGIANSSYNAAERRVVVTANDPYVNIQTAVNEKKEAMADKLLADVEFKGWVEKLKSITVKKDIGSSTTAGKEIINKGDSKAFLIEVVDAYTEELVNKLKEDGVTNPTWGDLDKERIHLTITATPKETVVGAQPQTESCTVVFRVDETAGDDLDNAIKRAIARMNDGPVIESITGNYNAGSNTITITGTNPDLDFIDSKNQSRDKTVQILLSELGEHMDSVDAITFSYEYDGIRDSITVKKDGRETTEQYIADLVDKWTDKLVKELNKGYQGDGNPNAFGRLDGKKLFVKAIFTDGTNAEYMIAFNCGGGDDQKPALDKAVNNAINRLSKGNVIPGVGNIAYNVSKKNITVTGNNSEQDIMASKNAGRDKTVKILLEEMGEYMDDVSEVTFAHTEENVKDSITVKRDDHESSEAYVSSLVDKWTDKLVTKLESQGKAPTYGSLDGETLEVKVVYKDSKIKEQTYTINFVIGK